MDFAADAVFDVVAPPTRPTPARAQAKADDGPSFDEHLENATAKPEPPTREERASEKPSETPPPTENKETTDKTAEPAPSAETTDAPAPVFVVQIVTPPPAPVVAPTIAADVTAPVESAEAGAAPPAEAPPPETAPQSAPVDGEKLTAKSDVQPGKPAPPPLEGAPDTPDAPIAQASAAPPAEAPVVTPTVAPQTAAPEATPELQTAQAMAAVQSTPPAPREAPRSPKPAASEPTIGDEPQKADAQPTRGAEATTPPRATPIFSPMGAAPRDSTPATPAPAADIGSSSPAAAPSFVQQSAHAQQTAAVDHSATRIAPAATQVAREIVRQFNGETTTFEMRLDPPELGRVEVRLEVTRDHRVTAVVAADNPQALTELARHARELEQTLQSAGLELTDNGLSFDLRQGGEGDAEAGDGSGDGRDTANAELEPPVTQSRPLGYERWRGVRVDLTV